MFSRPARPVLLSTVLVFLVASVVALSFDRWYAGLRQAALREAVRVDILPYADLVTGALGRRVAQITTLKAFVENVRDVRQLETGFGPFSAGLTGGVFGLRAVEIVRRGRIAMVYPLKGNERALDVEFMRHSSEALRGGYQRALTNEAVTIVGPIRLVQGGDGLILFMRARPAYDPSIELVELVVDLPGLLRAVSFSRPPEGLAFELRDRMGQLIAASHGALAADPVIVSITGFDGRWELRGAPVRGWNDALSPSLRPMRVAVALIVLLVTLVAYQLAEREARLTRLVEVRTTALRQLAVDQQATIVRQQETELALASSEERLRLALTASRTATYEIDVATGNMSWSEGVGPMVGRLPGTSPDTVAESLEYVEPPFRQRVAGAFATARLAPSQGTLEFRAQRADGGVTWLALTWGSRADSDGVVRRIVGTMTDISERKRLEEQFLHAQKMQAMGALAGGVAHDFNNLLTVIMGAGHMARRAADEPGKPVELRSDLEEVLSAAQRAAVLTGQLLAFSRRGVVQPRHFDLRVLIGGTETMLRRLVGELIRIETAMPEAPAPVFADQGQLAQVVMNLAINARDAMPAGGTLRIGVRIGGPPDGAPMPEEALTADRFVVLSVADTGSGIDPAIIPAIFDPFFTTKPVGQGTGLGLATVYGIVVQLGGTLRVRSELGRGSTFEVYVPLDADAPTDGHVVPPPMAVLDGAGRTILLAEDEPGLRKLAERTLTSAGYHVILAEDGAEALAASRAHAGTIDLLVSDVVMPGLGGVDLAANLLEERPGLRVLMMSGYPKPTVPESAALLNDVPFLAKPFLPSDLLAAAQRALTTLA